MRRLNAAAHPCIRNALTVAMAWTSANVPTQPHDSGHVRSAFSEVAPDEPVTTVRGAVRVTESPLDGVRIVSLNNGPVNTLTSDVMKDLIGELRRLADPESKCRGVVLTSDLPTTFSSGLDLGVLAREPFDTAVFAHYWSQFQELFLTMHSYPLPLVAAINGHAPAAGCILACACDYRIMVDRSASSGNASTKPFTIGITAARAGFSAPYFVSKNLSWIVGRRVAEDLLCRGATLSAPDALKVGLIDEVVTSRDEAVIAALNEVDRYLELPMEHTRWLVKDHMRRPIVAPLMHTAGRKEDCVYFAEMIQAPSVREDLLKYIQSLSKKPKS